MPSADEVSRLLLTLYAAPTRPELWAVFLREFADALGLPSAAILHQSTAREEYRFEVATGLDPMAMALYGQHYSSFDPFRPRFIAKLDGEPAFAEDLCPKQTLRTTEFYNDYLLKHDFTLYCAIATIKRSLSFEHISLYENIRRPRSGSNALATIELVVPHIHAVLRLQRHLQGIDLLRSNCTAALDSLHLGIMLVDKFATCLFANQKAEAIVRLGDGLSMVKNRLTATIASESAALSVLIQSAILIATDSGTELHGRVLVSRCAKRPLSVAAVALSRQPLVKLVNSARTAVVAIFIRDPDLEKSSLSTMMTALYRLTAAESRVALLLYEGRSTAEAAALNQVSRDTVRTQLKAIFLKTGMRRQSELLRLMTQLATL